MCRTKVNRNILFPLLLVIFAFNIGYSQQVEFKATALEQVAVGDQFRLTYILNTNGTNFRAPSIRDFSLLSGPAQGYNSSMRMINGQVSRMEEHSYTYVLQAIKEGTFTIEPATIVVEGKTYTSNPLTIKVVKGTSPQQQAPRQSNEQPTKDISSNDVFLRAGLSKANPYQGEQVIVTYKLYTRVPISEYTLSKTPAMTGFWTENLIKNNSQLSQYKEYVNGVEYVVAEFKKDALFAQKSGKLVIEPLELDITAQLEIKRRRSNDPFEDFFNNSFFGSNYQNVRKKLVSNTITLNVKLLPDYKGEFSGAVGSFNINTTIDKNILKANDAITLRFDVSGSGNLKLIDKPGFSFPTDFDVYDPRITDDIKTSATGISGKRSFEILLVPRNHGKYTIKPYTFTFFDPAANSYKSLSTPEFNITVEKGTGNDAYTRNITGKEDFRYIGTDIRFINTSVFKLKPINAFLFGSFMFWALLLLPLLLFIAFVIIWQKELKRRGNIALMRNKRATRIAKKRLKTAEVSLKNGNQTAFCNEVSSALWGYISDKFNIPPATLSMESVTYALQKKNVKEELISRFVNALNNCEYARFAPGDKTSVMANLYSEALEVITMTEQELK